MKIFISDKSFGKYDQTAMKLLGRDDVELVNSIILAEGVIAGTEMYDAELLSTAKYLRVISRMGVGYDNIDLDYCRNNNITVTYTPDAPSGSVAELTIAQMLNLIRLIPQNNHNIHNNKWRKPLGKKLSELTIGVIGVGRIGSKVIRNLQPFSPKRILVHDTDYNKPDELRSNSNYDFNIILSLEKLLSESDIVTVHIPMNDENANFINYNFISAMKDNSYLINTSRGGILDEKALERELFSLKPKLSGIALDVFVDEPYAGNLTAFDKVLMTPHIGSMTLVARRNMEVGAVLDCIKVIKGDNPVNPIPETVGVL